MLNNKRLLDGMTSGITNIVIKSAIRVILAPFMIRLLGVELFGLYNVLWAIFELNHIVQLSLGDGIVKLLGTFRTLEMRQEAEHLLWVGKWLFMGLAFLATLASWGIIPFAL